MIHALLSRRVGRVLRVTGATALVTSVMALVLGLVMVESGARDFRATVAVSNGAVEAVVETVDLISESTAQIQEGIDAAASGVQEVSATAVVGAASIEDVATFLETDLRDNITAIREAMPAAIQAAGAIDGTLRALSFIGVDYGPEESFDDSLRAVDTALASLPDDLETQAESMRDLVPVAANLAGEADRLAIALTQLAADLEGIEDVANSYDTTLTEAIATIESAETTLDRNIWLLRFTLLALALGGAAVGVGLYSVGGFVDTLVVRNDEVMIVQDVTPV